jgi:hypothetical protein
VQMGREKQSWKSQWDEYCFPYPRIDGAGRHNVTREGDAMLREHFCLHNWPSGHFESSAAGRVSHISCILRGSLLVGDLSGGF